MQHDVIAGDGGVGLELEDPVAVVPLPCQQILPSVLNDVIELVGPKIQPGNSPNAHALNSPTILTKPCPN